MIVPPTNTIDDITKVICAPSALSHRYAGVSGDQLLRTQVPYLQRSFSFSKTRCVYWLFACCYRVARDA